MNVSSLHRTQSPASTEPIPEAPLIVGIKYKADQQATVVATLHGPEFVDKAPHFKTFKYHPGFPERFYRCGDELGPMNQDESYF